MKLKDLTVFESYIIEQQGTEPPFSGEYIHCTQEGEYVCRRCSSPLFDSDSKFPTHCGWVSFDASIEEAIQYLTDADGDRVEIRCKACDAHLGHVFEGEGFTANNKRYCVNSVSLSFELNQADNLGRAVLGGGCFWCLDALFSQLEGIISVQVGYAGGEQSDAHYQDVCSGTTKHAEVVYIEFNQAQISYQRLLELFFATHDPTTLNRQGQDRGAQYRSVIFYMDAFQQQKAQAMMKQLTQSGQFIDPIVTELLPFEHFYEAEVEHKNYFERHPQQGYCQTVIAPKVDKLKKIAKNELLP